MIDIQLIIRGVACHFTAECRRNETAFLLHKNTHYTRNHKLRLLLTAVDLNIVARVLDRLAHCIL